MGERETGTAAHELLQEYRWPHGMGNVAARFEVYNFARPPFNIDEEIYNRIWLPVPPRRARLIDVGSYKGDFVYWLHDKYGDNVLGIEPTLDYKNRDVGQHVHFRRTTAERLAIEPGSVNVVFARFMMYNVLEAQQAEVLQKFESFLVPESGSCVVVSTSGSGNKYGQRGFEEIVAAAAGYLPPRHMNASFDSQRAEGLLAQLFKNIYHVSYRGQMVFESLEEAEAYKGSFMSMAPFFEPPLSDTDASSLYEQLVLPVLEDEINRSGRFADSIERDFFMCNNHPSGLTVLEGDDIKTVRGYEKIDLGLAA